MKTTTVEIYTITYDTSAGMGTDLFLTQAEADAALFDHLQWYGEGDERTDFQTAAFKEQMLALAGDPEDTERFQLWENWLEGQQAYASRQNDYFNWGSQTMEIPVPQPA